MNHNIYYYAGVICGLLVGVLIVAVTYALKKKNHTACEFDERQELMRGKAFQYGFIAMLIYLLGYSAFADITGFSWGDNLTSGVIAVLVGVGVFAAACIWKDAYFALQEKAKSFILLDLVLMIVNFINGYNQLTNPEHETNVGYLNMALAFFFLFILVTMGIKSIHEKRHVEME